MPGFLLHVGAVVQCTHFAPASCISSNTRVLVNGMPVATSSDNWLVTGCPFTVPGPKPQPCVRIQWLMPATRILINGQPPILQASPGTGAGVCLSPEQITQGPPTVSVMQARVMGI